MAGSGLFSNQAPEKRHLVRGKGGVAGEVEDLRGDVANVLGEMAAITVEEFTDPPAADPDGLLVATATIAAPTTYSGAGLDGALAGTTFDPPRNIVFTTGGATPANAPATATVIGTDVNGAALTETVTLAQTAATATTTSAFATVTSVELPAADGVAATLAIGTGDALGLSAPLKSRAGAVMVIREIEAGTAVTTGTFADAAAAAPNGTYTPATVADGSNDYALVYEYSPVG